MKTLAIIAAAGFALSGFAATIAMAADGSDKFISADANKDNVVSMAEAMGVFPTLPQTLFDQADANHDGNLDASEFTSLEGLTAGLDTGTTSAAPDASSSAAPDASSSASSAQ